MPLRVVVIVEGHGEQNGAVRVLLEKLWYDLLGGDEIEVMIWRGTQGQLRKKETMRVVIEAAAVKPHSKDRDRADLRRLLLLLLDSEGDECPREKAPERVAWAREVRSDEATVIACVMPNPMFETWFAAAAESLRGKNGLPNDLPKPADPEKDRLGKGWIKKHLPRKYEEPVDQPKFVGHMSLTECRDASRSFRKLIDELRRRLPAPAPPQPAGPAPDP